MPIWDHLEELRERVLVGALAAAVAIGGCFCFSKELVLFLEAPVADAGVRFLQLSPGEFFFTTFKVPLAGVWRARSVGMHGSAEHVLTERLYAVDCVQQTCMM